MAAPYPRKKTTETLVKQICSKVIWGKTDPTILNRLANLQEHIERKNYTSEEIATYIPFVKDRSYEEMVSIYKAVYNELYERIKDTHNNMLQTFRMYIALTVLKPEKDVPMNNVMIEFCRKYWKIDNNGSLKESLKLISLIDRYALLKTYQN